jgi:hypothetical protein
VIRALARLTAAAALVVTGGLALQGGAAQAAACSGTTGVTVVIDYGSSSATLCAPDSSSAIRALTSVASVTYPPQYQGSVVCQINSVPSQPCTRMPPSSAYWAFFHASRGGSWTYSSSGVAEYDPPSGSVIGFAFGSGGAPSSAPPPATGTPTPSPSSTPKPSSSTSSTPRSTSPHATATGGGTTGGSAAGTSSSTPRSTSAAMATGSGASTRAPGAATATRSAPTRATTSGTTTSGQPTASAAGAQPFPTSDDRAPQAVNAADDAGSSTSLLAGLGLVGVVGAGAAYLTIRRRAHG